MKLTPATHLTRWRNTLVFSLSFFFPPFGGFGCGDSKCMTRDSEWRSRCFTRKGRRMEFGSETARARNPPSLSLRRLLSVFTWRHSGHICVPKQWKGGHVGVPKQWKGGHVGVANQSCASWTLSCVNAFFCSHKFAQMLATWVKTLYK